MRTLNGMMPGRGGRGKHPPYGMAWKAFAPVGKLSCTKLTTLETPVAHLKEMETNSLSEIGTDVRTPVFQPAGPLIFRIVPGPTA